MPAFWKGDLCVWFKPSRTKAKQNDKYLVEFLERYTDLRSRVKILSTGEELQVLNDNLMPKSHFMGREKDLL